MEIGEGIFMISKFRREILSKTKGYVQMGILSKRILPTSSFSYLEVKDMSCGESSGIEEIRLGERVQVYGLQVDDTTMLLCPFRARSSRVADTFKKVSKLFKGCRPDA